MAFETVTGYCWPQSVAAGEQVGLHLSSAGGRPVVGRGRPGRRRAHGRVHRRRRRRPTTTPRRPTRRPPAAAGRRPPRSRSTRPGARATTRWSSRSTSTARPGAATPSSWCARRRRRRRAPILLALATNTWHAYNDFGGRNLYNGGTQVSLQRPMSPGLPVQAAGPRPPGHRRRRARPADGRARRLPRRSTTSRRGPGRPGGPTGSCRSSQWAEREGYAIDVVTNADLEDHPELLGADSRLPAVPLRRPRRVLVGADARHRRGLHRRGRQRRVPLGQHVVLAGAPGGPDARGPGRHHGRLQGPASRTTRCTTPTASGRAHEHLVRPPHRPAREPHDRRELLPRRLPPHRQGRCPTAPAATRSTGPTTGCSTAPASATATCSAPTRSLVGYECDGCDLTYARRPARTRPAPTARPTDFEILGTAPAAHFTATTATRPPKPDEPSELEFIAARLFDTREPGGRGPHRPRPRRARHATVARAAARSSPRARTDWAHGLAGRDPQVEQITRNLLDRLSS